MSRRRRRLRPCPLCWDMGADAPTVTHRVVYRLPGSKRGIFHDRDLPPLTLRVRLCEYHARDRAWESPYVTAYRMRGRR